MIILYYADWTEGEKSLVQLEQQEFIVEMQFLLWKRGFDNTID